MLSPHEAYFLWTRNACQIVRHSAKIGASPVVEAPRTKLVLPKRVEFDTDHTPNEYLDYEDVDAEALWKSYFEADEARILRQKVFESLWSRGFYVQASTHLFTDFVVYEADPLLIHAAFVVVCLFWDQKFKLLNLMSYARLASTVKKSILLASERPSPSKSASGAVEATEETLSNQLEAMTLGDSSKSYGRPSSGKDIALIEIRWSGVS